MTDTHILSDRKINQEVALIFESLKDSLEVPLDLILWQVNLSKLAEFLAIRELHRVLIVKLAGDELQLLESRVDQLELTDVVQEEGQIVVWHVEVLEVEDAFAALHVVVWNQVGLGVVYLAVVKDQVCQFFKVWSAWVHEV